MPTYDCVIIGAGPSGLAASIACTVHGLKVLVLERGVDSLRRNRKDALDLPSGVGGAGLFSDGKFSFHPAATNVWRLRPTGDLEDAYRWLNTVLQDFGIPWHPFPNEKNLFREPKIIQALGSGAQIFQKDYPSHYLSIDARHNLISHLRTTSKGEIDTQHEFEHFDQTDNGFKIYTSQLSSQNKRTPQRIFSKTIVIATGRLGALLLQKILKESQLVFKRIEYGIRIEQPSSKFLLEKSKSIDPKLLVRSGNPEIQYRTFCCCRDGEVVRLNAEGILSVAGRADDEPSSFSNIGFLTRITSAHVGKRVWESIVRSMGQEADCIAQIDDLALDDSFRLNRTSQALQPVFGAEAADLLAAGLQDFVKHFPVDRLQEVVVHAPAIEGIGYYPKLTGNLQIGQYPIWAAGDVTGLFRGIVAAMISGYFVGLQVASELGMRR